MGKSKSGGTRSFLRGRVGADVYSIGKDGKGNRQQVVRSLAEQVANPQTLSQMRGRMIMSTVMQAVSALKPIIDHSFDGLTAGQPSLSEFIRRNYALIKADVAAHPASGNSFGLNEYQEKGIKAGAYEIAAGQAAWPSAFNTEGNKLVITLPSTATTAGAIRAALGTAVGDYFTQVVITSGEKVEYARFIVADTLDDSVVITDDNAIDLFEIVANGNADVTFNSANHQLSLALNSANSAVAYGYILSVKSGSEWKHSNTTMIVVTVGTTADVALPTYPLGQERFLNGGALAGTSSVQSAAASSDAPSTNPEDDGNGD